MESDSGLTFQVLLRPVPDIKCFAHELDERACEVLGFGTAVGCHEIVSVRHAAWSTPCVSLC